jgi:hypothetical protein
MQDSKLEAFKKAVTLLENNQIKYWVCNGTLLGLIRGKELIPWDHDLDFGLDSKTDKSKMIKIFESAGMNLSDSGRNSDYLTFNSDGTLIDLNFFSSQDGLLVSLWKVPKKTGLPSLIHRILARLNVNLPKLEFFWTLEGYQSPIEFIYPLKNGSYFGLKISLPNQPEKLLEFTYGKNWIKPKRDYDWRTEGANNATK